MKVLRNTIFKILCINNSSKFYTLGSQKIIIKILVINLTQLRRWVVEGNGIPLQYSCLENPMDGGAW